MARALLSICLATGLVGCAGSPPLPCPSRSDFVNAPAEQVLTTAATHFEARGYSAYLGNPDMVVASRSESTFWTRPALVTGFVSLPVFILTWPVVSLFDRSLHKEATMWWPLRAFAWERSTYKDTQIWLTAKPQPSGGSCVTVEVSSPDWAPQVHARQVMDALVELEGGHPDPVTSPPTGNTR